MEKSIGCTVILNVYIRTCLQIELRLMPPESIGKFARVILSHQVSA